MPSTSPSSLILCCRTRTVPSDRGARRNTIDKFLTQIRDAGLSLEVLTVAQVDELLIREVRDKGYSRATIQTRASSLRAFFRYAEGRGWCRSGLAAAIMVPRVFRYEGLPAGVSWDCVKKVLAAAQGDRCSDIRDRALLMLLAVYGLRAGEVVALRLEDFDWEREVLPSHTANGRSRGPTRCAVRWETLCCVTCAGAPSVGSERGVPHPPARRSGPCCGKAWDRRLADDCTPSE